MNNPNRLHSPTFPLATTLLRLIAILVLVTIPVTVNTAFGQTQMVKSGQLVAASPIAIPRPIRLEVYSPSHKVAGLPIPIPKPALDTDTGIPTTLAV